MDMLNLTKIFKCDIEDRKCRTNKPNALKERLLSNIVRMGVVRVNKLANDESNIHFIFPFNYLIFNFHFLKIHVSKMAESQGWILKGKAKHGMEKEWKEMDNNAGRPKGANH